MSIPKFDPDFEEFIKNELSNMDDFRFTKDKPLTKAFAHGLSYTGGIDITDTATYEKKIKWVVKSAFINVSMRQDLTTIAEHLNIECKHKVKFIETRYDDIASKQTKMIEPSSFGKLGWLIVQKLREMQNACV